MGSDPLAVMSCFRRSCRPNAGRRGIRLSSRADQREAANIGHELRELCLIELVAAIVRNPHRRVREATLIALQMLERDLGVVAAVVQTIGDKSPRRAPKSGGRANSGNSGPQNGVASRNRPARAGRRTVSARYLRSTDAPKECPTRTGWLHSPHLADSVNGRVVTRWRPPERSSNVVPRGRLNCLKGSIAVGAKDSIA